MFNARSVFDSLNMIAAQLFPAIHSSTEPPSLCDEFPVGRNTTCEKPMLVECSKFVLGATPALWGTCNRAISKQEVIIRQTTTNIPSKAGDYSHNGPDQLLSSIRTTPRTITHLTKDSRRSCVFPGPRCGYLSLPFIEQSSPLGENSVFSPFSKLILYTVKATADTEPAHSSCDFGGISGE